MKILLSNDDGIYAPGIRQLAVSLKKIARICMVAPDRNLSGSSNALTLDRPLRARHLADEMISIDGTPADCVHLALTGLFHTLPDMVVSGINAGANLGDDILYSGTVAAAIEGRFLGFPAVAFSMAKVPEATGVSPVTYNYEAGANVAIRIVKKLIAHPLPTHTILNVNIPNVPLNEIRGFSLTRLGNRHLAQRTILQKDPRGNDVYWIGPAGPEQDAELGTDFYAIRHKCVSITPLKIDLTHYEAFESLSGWIENI